MRIVALVALMGLGCRGPVPLEPDLKTAGDSAPVAAGTLHLDHAVFAGMGSGIPVAQAADYLYVSGVNQLGQAAAQAAAPLLPGTYVQGIHAYVYGDDTALPFGYARILDVLVERVGVGPCPVLSPRDTVYTLASCPVVGASLILTDTDWVDPNGWQVKSSLGGTLVETGYTYRVIAAFRNGGNQTLRLGWVDVDYGDTPTSIPIAAGQRALFRRFGW